MKGRRWFLTGVMVAWCGLGWPAAQLRWVEVDVSPRQNGQADMVYKIHWSVRNFDLHGFYFQGSAATPVFNYEDCRALSSDGKSYGLSIKLSEDR